MRTKILIVDDSIVSANFLKNVLENENNYKIVILHDSKLTIETIEKYDIDVVLLDIIMPETNGYQVLEMMQHNESTKDIPVIVITELTSALEVKNALDHGALDFIRKTAEPIEIIARIHSAVKFKDKQDQLIRNSQKDQLTQLYNKQFFNTTIEKLIKEKSHYHKGIALLMIDCDYFKRINDNYGHTFGDVVLISVANAILKSMKFTDFACRFGGEEFCVILPNVTPFQAYAIAERIRTNIEKMSFKANDKTVSVTASFGISHVNKNDVKPGSQLVNEADIAMYTAKRKGRNQTVMFSENEEEPA